METRKLRQNQQVGLKTRQTAVQGGVNFVSLCSEPCGCEYGNDSTKDHIVYDGTYHAESGGNGARLAHRDDAVEPSALLGGAN